jgi:hypothetical protein
MNRFCEITIRMATRGHSWTIALFEWGGGILLHHFMSDTYTYCHFTSLQLHGKCEATVISHHFSFTENVKLLSFHITSASRKMWSYCHFTSLQLHGKCEATVISHHFSYTENVKLLSFHITSASRKMWSYCHFTSLQLHGKCKVRLRTFLTGHNSLTLRISQETGNART